MSRVAAMVAAGSLLVFGAACRTLPERVAIAPERERIEAWVRTAAENGTQRQSLRAVGSLKISGPDGSGRTKQVIVAARPDRLRFESLSLLGQTQTLLVTDGNGYGFFDGKGIERGPVGHDLLRERMGLDVEAVEAVDILLAGLPRVSAEAPRAFFTGVEGSAAFRAAYRGASFGFDSTGELRSIERRDASGRVRWTARYDRWRDVEGGRYPFAMQLDFPATELRLDIRLDDVELNASVEPSLFSLPVQRD